MAAALAAATVPFLAAPAGVSAAPFAPARSAASELGGFPEWYQDANGIRVELCYDPNDANCVAPASATYDPAQPLSFPGNYPDEMFYSAADSDLLVVDDSASCNTFTAVPVANPGVRVHMALEASFLNGTITPGDQMAFGRLRIIARAGSGLCPGTWYTFRTPYGPTTLRTDANGEIQGAVASAATVDTGCLPSPTTPCNFDLALGAPVLGVGLLRQVNNAAPGYLGSGLGLDTVTGGKVNGVDFNQFDVVKWPTGVTPSGEGVGIDCTDAGCAVLGSTDQFSVAAKLAGPVNASTSLADFGGQVLGTTSAARTIDITNVGAGALGLDSATIADVVISGADADQFAVSANDCAIGVVLARDASCAVAVTFTPSATAVANASLDITVVGSDRVRSVALKGTGVTSFDQPGIAFTPVDGNLDFGAVRLTNVSAIKDVTVTNTGTAPLLAQAVIAAGVDSAAFSIVTNSCATGYVAAGASCTVSVRFIPARVGPVAELLQIHTNTSLGVVSVALSAHGTGGVAAVSSTLGTNTFPEWYQDENGMRVGQCDDPANLLCIASPIAGALSFPTNYPDEWFYYIAQSAPMDVQDPTCNVQAGPMFVEAGMEAAFLGPIEPNQGITFGRLRIVSRGGLCPNTEYLMTHPYGRTVIATDDRGLIKPVAGTTDVGCLGAPCDYTIALSAPVFEGFLVQSVRPDGYLGDPVAPSTVTGAPYIDPSTGQPANHFTVQRLDTAGQAGSVFASTDQFGVSGRLVGPMVATPAAKDFGAAEVGLASAAVTHTVTFTNDGPFAVTLAATPLSLVGANAADYSIGTTTCTAGLTLAGGASCTADVRFAPQATGNRTAALRIHHSGGNNPLAVALSGVGTSPAGTAAISPSVASVSFTDLHVGLHSETVTLQLSNLGGSSALVVGTPVLSGAEFAITGNTCTGVFVQPGATCSLSVQFQPATVGAHTATITIPSNAQSGTLTVPVSGRGTNVTAAQSATSNAAGLPSWYQDGNGVRLEPCLAQDGNCVLLADATFNPALPIAWPTNFPSESFYALADSEVLTVPADASCGAIGGTALLRVATEAAFATLPPAPGGQAVFNRIRIVATGLCPNTTYQFVHPYGVANLTTDGNGDIRPKAGTVDVTNVTSTAPITPGVLRWDPNSGDAAPAGYLGDGRTLHRVVGSQFRLTPTGEPVNSFRVVHPGTGAVVVSTDLFTVSGRIVGPVVSSLESKDFGVVEVNRQSTTQTFTFTNLGVAPISALTASLTGTNAALFAITSNTCATVGTLATDQSCAIQVQFRPTTAAGVGAKVATLSLGHNGLRSPVVVALTGTAVAAQTPALTVTPTTLAFGTVVTGTTSTTQLVTVRNSGTGDLRLGTLAIGGTNPTQYSITATTCPNGPAADVLRAGTSCTMTVAFKPTTNGAKPATISVSATDAVTSGGHVAVVIPSVSVSLTGTGASGTISLSAATLNISARTGASATGRVTLTNTGTAPFSLIGNPALFFEAVSTNTPLPKFTVTSTGCTNVAVGKNCSVSVTFTPGAGTVAEVYRVRLGIRSNASNPLVYVAVNGTRAR